GENERNILGKSATPAAPSTHGRESDPITATTAGAAITTVKASPPHGPVTERSPESDPASKSSPAMPAMSRVMTMLAARAPSETPSSRTGSARFAATWISYECMNPAVQRRATGHRPTGTPERLVAAARECLRTRGAARTSSRAITDLARANLAAITYYF